MGDAVIDASSDVVLCINCGSSSLKFSVFRRGMELEELEELATGGVDPIGAVEGRSWSRSTDAAGSTSAGSPRSIERREAHPDHASALDAAFRLLDDARVPAATVVAHRIVHGGSRFLRPTRIDSNVMEALGRLVPLAPLHLPASIAGIRAVSARRPDVPQVACFDTTFHSSMPEHARRLAIPKRFDDQGVRRYGFHGLSYEYILSTLGDAVPSRLVIAHLGNGASLVAVKDGVGIDTTMGFTPAGGIMMGTRSGDLDPGVVVYLLQHAGLSVEDVERVVERESGLAAIGGTSDVKTLVERAQKDPNAQLALTMFAYGVRKAIGSFAAVLGGLDLLVFTGGIGEHAASVRADACAGLEFLGVELDASANARHADVISTDRSRCRARVIPTHEDRMLARHALELVHGRSP